MRKIAPLALLSLSALAHSVVLTAVLEVGQPVPGSSEIVSELRDYSLRGNGNFAVTGKVGVAPFVFYNGTLFLQGGANPLPYPVADEVDVNDVFAVIDGLNPSTTNFAGIHNSAGTAFLSSQAPPLPMPVSATSNFISSPRALNSGTNEFLAYIRANEPNGVRTDGIVRSENGVKSVIIYGGMPLTGPLLGQSITSGGFGISNFFGVSDNGEHMAFRVNLNGGGSNVVIGDPNDSAGMPVFWTDSSSYPYGANLRYGGAGYPRINNEGTLVNSGSFVTLGNVLHPGIFVNGAMALTSRSTIEGINLFTYVPGAPDINNANDVVSRWTKASGNVALIGKAQPGNALDCLQTSRMLLAPGTTYPYIEVNGTTSSLNLTNVSTVGNSIDDNGNMAFLVNGTDPSGAPRTAMVTIDRRLLADFDEDCEVGPVDFSIFVSAFGTAVGDPQFNHLCDLDFDGEVGPVDFVLFSQAFGYSCP